MYNDLDTLEEAIRQKVKESKKYTMKIEDIHIDEEDIRVGFPLHQNTNLSMPDTTNQLIVHRRWLSPCHESRGECQTNFQHI